MEYPLKFDFDPDQLDNLLDYILNECPQVVFQMLARNNSKKKKKEVNKICKNTKNNLDVGAKNGDTNSQDDNIGNSRDVNNVDETIISTTAKPPSTTTTSTSTATNNNSNKSHVKCLKSSTNINLAIAFDNKCSCIYAKENSMKREELDSNTTRDDVFVIHNVQPAEEKPIFIYNECIEGCTVKNPTVIDDIRTDKTDRKNAESLINNDDNKIIMSSVTNEIASTKNTSSVDDANNESQNDSKSTNVKCDNTDKTDIIDSQTDRKIPEYNVGMPMSNDGPDANMNLASTLLTSSTTSTTTFVTATTSGLTTPSPTTSLSSTTTSSLSSSTTTTSSSTTASSASAAISLTPTATTTTETIQTLSPTIEEVPSETIQFKCIHENIELISHGYLEKDLLNERVIIYDVKPEDDLDIKLICLNQTETETKNPKHLKVKMVKNDSIKRAKSLESHMNIDIIKREKKTSKDPKKIIKRISFAEDENNNIKTHTIPFPTKTKTILTDTKLPNNDICYPDDTDTNTNGSSTPTQENPLIPNRKHDQNDKNFPQNILRELEDELERLNDVMKGQCVDPGFHSKDRDKEISSSSSSLTTPITAIYSSNSSINSTRRVRNIRPSDKYADYLKETYDHLPHSKSKRAHSAVTSVHVSKLDERSKTLRPYDSLSSKSSSSAEIAIKPSINRQSADSDNNKNDDDVDDDVDDGTGSAIFCGAKREFFKGIKNWDILQSRSLLKDRMKKKSSKNLPHHHQQQQQQQQHQDHHQRHRPNQDHHHHHHRRRNDDGDDGDDDVEAASSNSSVETASYENDRSELSSLLMEEMDEALDIYLHEQNSTKTFDFGKSMSSYEKKSKKSTKYHVDSWYKPHISKTEAQEYLRNKPAGSFVIRNSNSFQRAYGLMLRVDQLSSRHSIENCNYASLKELVEEHTKVALSLPCKLIMPGVPAPPTLTCNVLYLCTEPVEHLAESAALAKALEQMNRKLNKYKDLSGTTVCNLMLSVDGGLVLTDSCRMWAWTDESNHKTNISKVFGIVTRTPQCNTDNVCHLFAELDFPADEIVDSVLQLIANLEHH
ncbi:hypothetical protein HELRODRAFT_194106 [Helobdella robusta]|uniref:SH2 domain-containing protein n=1 Tax=Helobdella robusta TaxID=6412 RepID=T1FVP3_HELRO|nr:hypothetical protein HELRODRAFT_194106 [Helobdella robusta]ESN93473.1 hypothetical protein HELRODRAFT_194106 [Helobdella robusta]